MACEFNERSAAMGRKHAAVAGGVTAAFFPIVWCGQPCLLDALDLLHRVRKVQKARDGSRGAQLWHWNHTTPGADQCGDVAGCSLNPTRATEVQPAGPRRAARVQRHAPQQETVVAGSRRSEDNGCLYRRVGLGQGSDRQPGVVAYERTTKGTDGYAGHGSGHDRRAHAAGAGA